MHMSTSERLSQAWPSPLHDGGPALQEAATLTVRVVAVRLGARWQFAVQATLHMLHRSWQTGRSSELQSKQSGPGSPGKKEACKGV